VEEVIGYLEEKSSTWIAQNVERKARNSLGHKLWARKYFVSRTPEIADKLQLKLAPP
jgi:putative transposase